MKPHLSAAILALASSGLLTALLLAGDAPPPPTPPPPPDQTKPEPPPAKSPDEAKPAEPAKPAEKPPKVVRTVCTDHICGHCDGKCHRKGGHVAVDKNGHCACTPDEGSALDRATRDAYEKHQPQ